MATGIVSRRGVSVPINGIVEFVNEWGNAGTVFLSEERDVGRVFKALRVSENRVLVVYRYNGTHHLCGMVLTMNGTNIELGDAVFLNETEDIVEAIRLVLLPDDRVFIVFKNDGDNRLYGTVISIINADIEPGENIPLCESVYTYAALELAMISENRIVIVHGYGNTYHLYGMVITINNAKVELGEDIPLIEESNAGRTLCILSLSEDRVLIVHRLGYFHTYAMIIKISGMNIERGNDTPASTQNSGANIFEILQLSEDRICITSLVNKDFRCWIATVDGMKITVGERADITVSSYYIATGLKTIPLSGDRLLFAHHGSISAVSRTGKIRIGKVIGTKIEFGNEKGVESVQSHFTLLELSENTIFAAYGAINLRGITLSINDIEVEISSPIQLGELQTSSTSIVIEPISKDTMLILDCNGSNYNLRATVVSPILVATPSTNCGLARTKGTSGATINVTRAVREDDTEDPEEAEG